MFAQALEYRFVEEPFYGIGSEVPADWQALGSGRYARAESPTDPSVIAIQSVPVPVEELWPSLLPQFRLDDTPAVTGTHQSTDRKWTLYRFDIETPLGEAAIELAFSERDGTTALVLLQAALDEFDALRDPVLLPALDAYVTLEPEPAPDAAAVGYSSEDVVFPGGSDEVELAATLTLPATDGPHQVVVLVSGSGGQDRNESMPITQLQPFAEIAHALSSAGVAVLRYDDRGVGESTGTLAGATLADIASDAAAAIDYLERRSEVDPERIGLVGHSEGGLIAAMLGANDGRPAFIVNMAGPAVVGSEVLRRQNVALLEVSGTEPAFVDAYASFLDELYPLVIAADAEAARALSTEFHAGAWDLLSEETRSLLGEMTRDDYVELQTDALVGQLIENPASAPWFRSFLVYDTGADWAEVTAPVLGLFGAKDVQVLADQNEPALRARLAEAGNDDVTTVIFDEANHLFQDAETGSLVEYASLEPEFSAEFLPTLVEWVVERAGLAQ